MQCRFAVAVLAMLLVAALSACSDDDSAANDSAVVDAASADAAAYEDAEVPGPDSAVQEDASVTCEATPLAVDRLKPRIMILLDQSPSMAGSVSGLPGQGRLAEVADALSNLFADPGSLGRDYGLDAFPDGDLTYLENCYDECCANPACRMTRMMHCMTLSQTCGRGCTVDLPPIVPLAEATVSASQITDYLSLPYLPTSFGSTPLVAQLAYYTNDALTVVPELYVNDGLSYLLVVSDGGDTCFDPSDPPDIAAIVAELTTHTQTLRDVHNVKTIVVGFNETTGDDAQQLNAIAANGGTSFSTFFPLAQAGDLQQALDTVFQSVPDCQFELTGMGASADLSTLELQLDGAALIYEATCLNGWHFATADGSPGPHVELCGTACDSFLADPTATLEAAFGCP